MGDHTTGTALAGAACAALYARECSGQGQHVNVSLVRSGIYTMSWDMSLALRLQRPILPYDRAHAVNPLITCYKSSDDRWFWLLLLQADRHWALLCRAVGREELVSDERFDNIEKRRNNAPALVAALDEAFSGKTMEEWAPILDEHDIWWAPVNSINEAVADPVVRASGAFSEVTAGDETMPVVSTPADFSATPQGPRGPAPELGQHTEEVLLELGYDWDRIIALKEAGAIP
jgi:crotonobetainyl-CoA:carnitine CoA-transferase CaiB-like acyl-CoA transferase